MPYPIYYPSLCLFYLFIYIHPTFPLIFWGGFQPTNNSFIVAKQMLMQHHIHMERQMLSHKPREQGQLCCLGLDDCGHSCLEQCSSSDHAARICWCWANTSYYREYTEPYSNRKTLYQQWTVSKKNKLHYIIHNPEVQAAQLYSGYHLPLGSLIQTWIYCSLIPV